MESIIFETDDNEQVKFFVLETTKIAGKTYILVTDSLADEADAFILQEIAEDESGEVNYELIDDEDELSYIGKIFAELLEDTDII